MYPKIEVNLPKLRHNTKKMVKLCKDNGIKYLFGVVKVVAGDMESVKCVVESGITHIADSRIENLKSFQNFDMPKVLLRLPGLSNACEVVKYASISLNSELSVIKKLSEEAAKQNKNHGIILMFDLGDLREGIFYKTNYQDIIKSILALPNISLEGIGTNLTCYGGVLPTVENLSRLVDIKEQIERDYKIELTYISGGNSSSLYLLEKEFPRGINSLRLGESIFLGRETAFGADIPEMYQDVFTLHAEIIELKTKPSCPIGEIGMDAFGKKPVFVDKGIMKRAICAVGKQDVFPDNLTPTDEKISIIGASSDHLLLDVTGSNYKVGEIVTFKVSYGGLLQLMTSSYIKKEYVRD